MMALDVAGPAPGVELPLPVVRWLEAAWPDGVPAVDSIVVAGPVRIRRGRLRLPGHCTMRFLLGVGYVSDIGLGIGPLTLVRALDALADGTGITRVGGKADIGPEIDQGTFLALWCQSILFPSAWPRLHGLNWLPVDGAEARVELPFRGGIEAATVRFDPDGSPFPIAFEADRHQVVGGPRIGWRVDYLEWRRLAGLAVPTRTVVTWATDPGPWFEMRVRDVVANEPLADALERARRAIREARATGH